MACPGSEAVSFFWKVSGQGKVMNLENFHMPIIFNQVSLNFQIL